jgi:hypothetical protein
VTEEEALVLTRYVKACCPGQHIDKYTPDAWADLLEDLDYADCELAAAAVAKRQPFVGVAEIRAEVRRIRSDRLARSPLPAPPAELADDPGRYQRAVQAGVKRIADGASLHRAIAGAPLPGEPPPAWQQAREALEQPAPVKPDPREVAAGQVAESRAAAEERARRERGERAS